MSAVEYAQANRGTDSVSEHLIAVSVAETWWETNTVRVLALRASGRQPLPPAECGSHVDLRLPGGEVRSYSLINAGQDQDRYLIAVQTGATDGARWLTEELGPGDAFRISAPENSFRLVQDACAILFIAGGIGITPFLSMVEHCAAAGRSWRLLYAARSRKLAPFLQRLAPHEGRVQLHCDDEHEGRVLSIGPHLQGLAAGTYVYCCGPAAMMADLEYHRTRLPYLRFHRAPDASGAPGS